MLLFHCFTDKIEPQLQSVALPQTAMSHAALPLTALPLAAMQSGAMQFKAMPSTVTPSIMMAGPNQLGLFGAPSLNVQGTQLARILCLTQVGSYHQGIKCYKISSSVSVSNLRPVS